MDKEDLVIEIEAETDEDAEAIAFATLEGLYGEGNVEAIDVEDDAE